MPERIGPELHGRGKKVEAINEIKKAIRELTILNTESVRVERTPSGTKLHVIGITSKGGGGENVWQ